ncbi:MAG: TetR/AcrR family transcriptional regulator [Dethiobacteraceae bacterium]|mgnify:CR=1 FL=1|jgi:AcrR family transcriptional regulator
MQYLKPEIRAKILSSALDEFAEHGYARAQMRRIAQGAGISTSNIYRYFAGKEAIFAEIVRRVHEQVSALIANVLKAEAADGTNVQTAAQQIADGIMTVYLDYGRELLVIIDKSEGSKYADFKDVLLQMLCQRIKKTIFNQPSELDETVIYVLANGFLEGIFIIMRKEEDPQRIATLINRLVSFYFEKLEKRLVLSADT